MAFRIGIDFDNTIVCYDEVFVRTAKAEGLIPHDLRGGRAFHGKDGVNQCARTIHRGKSRRDCD